MNGEWTSINLRGWTEIEHKSEDGSHPSYCSCPGKWTQFNQVKDSGKALVAMMIMNATDYTNTYIALGTGTTAFSAASSRLIAELLTGGLARTLATTAKVTTTIADDTARWTNTFTCATNSTIAVTEEGITISSTTGSTAYFVAAQTFSAINMTTGDTLAITHNLQFS